MHILDLEAEFCSTFTPVVGQIFNYLSIIITKEHKVVHMLHCLQGYQMRTQVLYCREGWYSQFCLGQRGWKAAKWIDQGRNSCIGDLFVVEILRCEGHKRD